MTKRAVMFDLDGTLIDTLADLGDAMNSALESLGYPQHDYPFYKKAVGDGAPELVVRSLPPAARIPSIIDPTLLLFRTAYENCWANKTRPYAGIEPLLAELQNREIIMAVLSNKPDPKTRDCVAHFFPKTPFTIIRGALDGVSLKPAPAAAISIMTQLAIPPSDWLYVGDTDTDMKTARNANLFAVGALWGFRDRDELATNGADALITTPADLLSLL